MCFEIKIIMVCGYYIISMVCDFKKVYNQSCEGQWQCFIYDICVGCDLEYVWMVFKQYYEQSYS